MIQAKKAIAYGNFDTLQYKDYRPSLHRNKTR